MKTLMTNKDTCIQASFNKTTRNQHPLDSHLRKLSSRECNPQIFKEYIEYQFNAIFEPAYFGAICWSPFAFTFEEAIKESRHFKNRLLAAVYGCKLYQIPKLPDRSRIVIFQEVKEVLINPKSPSPKYRQAFHTHFHLEGSNRINGVVHLESIIQSKARPGFDRLKRRDTQLNRAVVIKAWDREFHSAYNLKDCYSNQYLQDGDLVVDYENSDLG
jgi:hypothetical protein